MKKNLFLTFCFALIPGAGQMYQGYMKRGLSIMLIFAFFCALTGIVSMPLFAIPLPVIFAYAFFDTFNLRTRIGTQEQDSDEYVWKGTSFENVFGKLKISKKNKTLGVALILLGIYLLVNSVLRGVAYTYDLIYLYNFINMIVSYLPPIIIAAISIGIGIKFISNKP